MTPEDVLLVLDDTKRLTRDLDVALNGDGAAPQASLCDIVGQVKALARDGAPVLEDAQLLDWMERVKPSVECVRGLWHVTSRQEHGVLFHGFGETLRQAIRNSKKLDPA